MCVLLESLFKPDRSASVKSAAPRRRIMLNDNSSINWQCEQSKRCQVKTAALATSTVAAFIEMHCQRALRGTPGRNPGCLARLGHGRHSKGQINMPRPTLPRYLAKVPCPWWDLEGPPYRPTLDPRPERRSPPPPTTIPWTFAAKVGGVGGTMVPSNFKSLAGAGAAPKTRCECAFRAQRWCGPP
jgi:hypothetical protein